MRQIAEQFGVFRHAAHVRLEESEALFQAGDLLEELFFSELSFQAGVSAFISGINSFFHDVLLAAEAAERESRSRSGRSVR